MDSNIQIPVSKNQIVFEGSDNVDRLSTLPTDLICRILSLLPTKYAARSAILSTRWKNICASLTVFDFDMNLGRQYRRSFERIDSNEKDQLMKFADFVDQLLGIHLKVNARKFRLTCPDWFDMVRLLSWLKMDTMSNLEELDLEVVDSNLKLGTLPSKIFRYKSLVVLKLTGHFAIDLPSDVSLPSLKLLYLSRFALVNGASLQSLLCGCPVLEDLNIHPNGDESVSNYVISVPSLKRLTLIYLIYGKESRYPKDTLSLHTPNLEYLSFGGDMPRLISVTKMPFLSEADITLSRYCGYDEGYEIGPSELLGAAPNVCQLSLGGETQLNLEAGLSCNENLFQRLTHLNLDLATWFGPMLLPYFMWVSPKLSSIAVRDGISGPCSIRAQREHDWIPPNNVPECLLFSLKEFKIWNLCGQARRGMKMIKYFLKNAMVLEKMTIHIRYLRYRETGEHVFTDSKRQELMNCPRGSPDADLFIDTRVV